MCLLIQPLEYLPRNLPDRHFEITNLLNDNILCLITLLKQRISKLRHQRPYNIHSRNASLKIVVIGQVKYLIDEIGWDLRLQRGVELVAD